MEKINFINNQQPAVNDRNLNKLQDNVEDAIADVQLDTDTKLDADNIKTTPTNSDTDTYSCNYINGIVESGNNANGNYIKYVDGTMICYGKKTVSTTRSITWGSLSVSPKINSLTYPQTFVGVPTTNLFAESSGNSVWTVSAEYGTVSGTPAFYIASATSESSTVDYRVNYIAIGRWK